MIEPIGPLPREVYWRRHAVALGAVLLAAALVGWGAFALAGALSGGAEQAGPPRQASPAPPALAAAPAPCSDRDLRITAEPVQPDTPVGKPVALRMSITNTGPQPCTRDLGRMQREVVVSTADGSRFWSSTDCHVETSNENPVLAPGAAVRNELEWPGVSSKSGQSPAQCATERDIAPAGTYLVGARLGGLVSKPVPFRIR